MPEVLLFVKDFELGSRLSEVCVDQNRNVEFSDEKTDPNTFPELVLLAIVDMDEKVFSSVGFVAELKRRNIKVIGTMKRINNKEQSKLRTAGCDIILPRASLIKNIPNLLEELFPEKVDLYDYSEFHIIETGANYKFPVHDDTPNKLLSGVIYINPEKNAGTIFYENKKGDGKKYVDWKQNRAVFFSRKERETWHSYEGDGKSNRIALVYNLMTSRIKQVCRIEKKNYFVSKLRYKINPYLFRFFRFTI